MLSGLHKLKEKNRKRIFFGTFPSEVRPESVKEETLRITQELGDNDNLTMGAQSGSPKILASIRRGHTVEQVFDAVDLALLEAGNADELNKVLINVTDSIHQL